MDFCLKLERERDIDQSIHTFSYSCTARLKIFFLFQLPILSINIPSNSSTAAVKQILILSLFQHLESTTCYFLAENFRTNQFQTCKTGRVYRQWSYAITFLPYIWHAMQCARRWYDESDPNHLANLGKYVSAMVAAGARLSYARHPDSHLGLGIVLATSAGATIYQLYWDFVKDWGLFDLKSRNLWLRDELILRNKSIYYVCIAINVVLRVAWVESVMGFRTNRIESELRDSTLASLEVIRRGHWNFYRLENEHLNKAGKFSIAITFASNI